MKTRILTSIVLVAIFVPVILIGDWLFAIAVALVIGLAALEVCQSGHGNNNWPRRVKIFTVLVTLLMTFWNLINLYVANPDASFTLASSTLVIPSLGIAATLLMYFILVILKSSINVEDVTYLFTMVMFLTLAGQGALYVRGLGVHAFIYVALVSFMSDTGGYFAGMLLGRNKINPRISPKKTYEGAFGATIVGTLSGIAYCLIFLDQVVVGVHIWWLIGISLVLSIFAQVGDFTFSAIKRHYGIKDFSHLLPGHGGILDRLDSIIVNLIVFSVIVINIFRGFNWWVS